LIFYDYGYVQDHRNVQGAIPIHAYDLSQKSLAAYWQTDHRNTSDHRLFIWRPNPAHQRYRERCIEQCPWVRRSIFLRHQAAPLDTSEVNHALHIGIEHRFNESFAVFARAASAFRTPISMRE